MASSAAVSSAPVTSWWYGQGGAVDAARRLESLYTLTPPPAGPAGLITARRDELTVTFVTGLKSPLPHPWRSAESNTTSEVCIPWDAVDPGLPPDPERPVYLVAFGTTDEGALVGLNLAAFQRIRIRGEAAVTTTLVSRWVLELLATHPDITIGVTPDVWRGPLTTRVHAVAVGRVPVVDVLVCGPDLTYSDRAQIVSNSASKIMIDLGDDAAVDTKWTITCGPDRIGQITNGAKGSRPMTVTLILPAPATVDRCADLLTDHPGPLAPPSAAQQPVALPGDVPLDEPVEDRVHDVDDTDTDPHLPIPSPLPPPSGVDEPIDFFAPPADLAAPPADAWRDPEPAPVSVVSPSPPPSESTLADTHVAAEPAELHEPLPAAATSDVVVAPAGAAAPRVAPIWNRILGQVDLCPPHSTAPPGQREKRLNELLVYLQHHRFAGSSEIVRDVYGGAASDKTVTQQVSLLRARLGTVRPGGPKSLPSMREGGYVLDGVVRSDWMEFERLVDILLDATATVNLIAAMDLVTGPPLGGVPTREWAWTKDLRDEIRDRVAGAAVVLAHRHHAAHEFGVAVEVARKGLWYDTARQDLWQIGLRAALDGHDKDAFKALRSQYLSTVAGPDRAAAVVDLTKQGV